MTACALFALRARTIGLSSKQPRRATDNDCPGQGSDAMRMNSIKFSLFASVALAAAMVLTVAPASAQQPAAQAVAIDNDDIGGVVTGPKGPEAGVWVIAETHDLGVRYIKIVVTDDRGRYVVPDLPNANYDVWVRGYGLVDSPKVKSERGKNLNL